MEFWAWSNISIHQFYGQHLLRRRLVFQLNMGIIIRVSLNVCRVFRYARFVQPLFCTTITFPEGTQRTRPLNSGCAAPGTLPSVSLRCPDRRGDWASSDLTARKYYSEGIYEVTSPSGKNFTAVYIQTNYSLIQNLEPERS
jgi:hypothetical protein